MEIIRVAIDVMGADEGPKEIIRGVVRAAEELKACGRAIYTLVGDQDEIHSCLASLRVSCGTIQVQHAGEVITMKTQPSRALRGDNSVLVAAGLVSRDKLPHHACITFGNTGAAMAVGQYKFGMIDGITTDRPPIVLDLPKANGHFTALDMGANLVCSSAQLLEFARVGQAYAHIMRGVECPKIRLLSNGQEPEKGTEVIKATNKLLAARLGSQFGGNIEPNDAFMYGEVDVLVCDGNVGNALLKTAEGVANLVMKKVKDTLIRTLIDKLILSLYRKRFSGLKEELSYQSYGGTPLLGLKKVMIVGHGCSDERAVVNAVKVAEKMVGLNLPTRLAEALCAS